MSPEPDTWDMKLGRAIRRAFDMLFFGPGGGREGSPIDSWERAKMEAWELEKEAARQRSSEEIHEELRRSSSKEQGP